jgi:hypothetical protein
VRVRAADTRTHASARAHTHTHTHTVSHTQCHTHTVSHTHTQCHTHTVSHTHSVTHTHTHSVTHTHTHHEERRRRAAGCRRRRYAPALALHHLQGVQELTLDVATWGLDDIWQQVLRAQRADLCASCRALVFVLRACMALLGMLQWRMRRGANTAKHCVYVCTCAAATCGFNNRSLGW